MRILFLILGLVGGVVSCGSTIQTHAVSTLPLRSGNDLEPFTTQYLDDFPVLSADGSKIVFITGRDSTATTTTLKAYKANWPAGEAPAAPSRLTKSEIGIEQTAVLSPDGTWVVLSVTSDAQTDLYLQDFAAANAPVRITNDANSKQDVSFSPDSKLLTWTTRSSTNLTSTAMIMAIGAGNAAAVATANQIALPLTSAPVKATPYPVQLFWLAMSGTNYVLGAGLTTGIDQSLVSYFQYTFATPAAAATVTPVLWLASYPVDITVEPVSTGTNAIIPRLQTPADYDLDNPTCNANPNDQQCGLNLSPKLGDGIPANDSDPHDLFMDVTTEPVYLSTKPGSLPTRYPRDTLVTGQEEHLSGQVPGYDLVNIGLSPDGNTVFMLDHKWYLCIDDNGNEGFGTGFDVMPTNVSSPAFAHIFPRLMANTTTGVPQANPNTPTVGVPFTEAYDTVTGPCDRARPDTSRSPVDVTMTRAAFNANATSSIYRIAYTTRFNPHYDANCTPKQGDPEVMLMDATVTGTTIYALSQNQYPQYDDGRGGSPLCILAP